MSAVWMRTISELRARWRAWLSVAIMIGIASGVVMAAAAGARRSDTAVGRFLVRSQATHVDVEADPSTFRAIAKLPQVESAGSEAFMLIGKALAETVDTRFSISVISLMDRELVPERIVSAGRNFHLDDAGEAMVNETALRRGTFKIGDRVALRGFSFDQLEDVLRGSTAKPKGPAIIVTIVGAVKVATDLSTINPPPGVLYTGNNVVLLTPAAYAKVGGQTAHFPGLSVRLKRGMADVPAFTAAVARLTNGEGVVHGGSDSLQAGEEAQKATHTEALALWLFMGLAALAAILVIGQSISRQIFFAADDRVALLSLGMTRGQSLLVAMIHVTVAAVVGSAIGVAAAITLSPATPIGLAREAEVDIGFHLDVPVILLGVAATVATLLLRAVFPAWRASGRARDGVRHPSRVAGALAAAGMPATSVAGVQMALDPGRGRNAVPVRTAIAGSVVAIAVLISALAFGSSLRTLADSPRQQGWTWDVAVGNPHSDDVTARAIPLLRNNPYVAEFSAETYGEIVVDGTHTVNALGLDTVVGSVAPPMLEGRQPRGSDEIALGTKALRALHKGIGDPVRVADPDGKTSRRMQVVGRALITPVIVNGSLTLGDGALMPLASLRAFVPPAESDQGAVNVFLVELKPGVDRRDAIAALQRDFPGTVLTPYAPAEVENLRRIDSLPFALAGLLGLLAVATIAHALVTSVRRRRHDLAILKTLGFVRGQVSATVSWQASTLIALAAALGLAGGVAVGRWIWVWYATRLGIRPEPAIPVLVLVAIVPTAILLANLVALTPARSAGRTKPALVLRTE